MVSVSNITNNINRNTTNVASKNMTPSFKGINPAEIERTAITTVESQYPKFINWLVKLDKMRGEKVNAWFTGVGTAIIAPIFIAMNPFSKEDKDTRIYSAWRQPISAVIALMMQLAVTRQFEHYMDRLASTGRLPSANLKANPADTYVNKLIKFQHPELNETQLKIENDKFSLDAFKREVDKARKTMQKDKITLKQLVGRDDYEKAREAVENKFKNAIKKMSKKDAEEFIKDKAIKKASANILDKIHMSAEKKFRIRNLVKNGVASFEEALKITDEQLAKLPKSISQLSVKQKREYDLIMAMQEQLKNMQVFEAQRGLKPFASIKNIGSTYAEILQNIKIKQYVSAMAENAKFSLKQQKVWYGMGVTLLTLPFSCGLLNWSYPRIMEKIMPHAYNKKQGQPPVEQRKEAKV